MKAHAINHSFEGEKNRKALMYTCIICGLFLLIAIFYTWPMKMAPVPVIEDLIEINLGNEVEGLGEVQPLVPGDKAPDNQSVASTQSAQRANESPSQNILAEESEDEEAAPVISSPKTKDNTKKINKESSTMATKNINPSKVENPNPAPKKPKIPLYKGGTGTGGNNAAEDNGYRNQGYKPGNGDAGSPDGKPDAYGNSPGGSSGGSVSVFKGLVGRKPMHYPSLTDNFNENAKVYVDIKVNASGKVIAATIARGTTTSNSTLRNIAIREAKKLKFPTSKNVVEAGTILFNFVLKS